MNGWNQHYIPRSVIVDTASREDFSELDELLKFDEDQDEIEFIEEIYIKVPDKDQFISLMNEEGHNKHQHNHKP